MRTAMTANGIYAKVQVAALAWAVQAARYGADDVAQKWMRYLERSHAETFAAQRAKRVIGRASRSRADAWMTFEHRVELAKALAALRNA